MALNQQMLDELCSWGRELPGFTRDHARQGLTLVQMYVEGVRDAAGKKLAGIGWKDYRSTFLLAMHMAWMFWLTDRLDGCAASLEGLEGIPRNQEGEALCAVRARLFELSCSDADRRLWIDTAREALVGRRERARLSRGEVSWSYAEYLHYSEHTAFLAHLLATVSLVYSLDMPARRMEPRFVTMLHRLSLSLRLQNDLASVNKERAAGERANAALLIERFMSADGARAFVMDELLGYTRLLAGDLEALGDQDSYVRIARVLLEATGQFYRLEERYSAAAL